MTNPILLQPSALLPDRNEVLALQGIPEGCKLSPPVEALLERAFEEFLCIVSGVGLIAEIAQGEFSRIYQGEGKNDRPAPLDRIFPRADSLALFAVTLGPDLCDRIKELFREKDYAYGYMLDSVASVGADQAAQLAQEHYEESYRSRKGEEYQGVLRYSPGYCGWHVSGQRRLFEYLQPSRIGIELNDSHLMQPIKSVSGVIVAGAREIHIFPNTFPFCSQCTTKSCRARIRSLLLQ